MTNLQGCPEFPYFGARYPDATCIDGYLWDLDKYENGMLYGGGDEPCPFCNAEAYIENNYGDFDHSDMDSPEEQWPEKEAKARKKCREFVEKLHERYNYKPIKKEVNNERK